MTATSPPASLKPNHITARNTIRMVGIVSINGMTASSALSSTRLSPIARPMPMPASIAAVKVMKMRASVIAMLR